MSIFFEVLELLYEEAKFNILTGRYPCEISDYIMLGGIQVGSMTLFSSFTWG